MADADKVDESENIDDTDDHDDQDYAPDPTETGSRSTKSDNSMTSLTSESSSLKTYLAGNTNISLYSHRSETGSQTRTRVDKWMEVAKTSRNKTKTRASHRLASIDKDAAHGTPETDTGGSFTEAPPALAQPLATAPDSPRPAQLTGTITRRSRLRPINTRPRSYLLARDNTTFRQYLPETETIVETVDLTITESDSENNSSKKSTK
jgi:hypothetical protein